MVEREHCFEDDVAKAFVILSRLGGLTEELWSEKNRQADIQLFRAIHHPERLPDLHRDRIRNMCMYGDPNNKTIGKRNRTTSVNHDGRWLKGITH